MLPSTRVFLLVAVALAMSLGGCRNLQTPSIAVASIHATGQDNQGVALAFQLRLTNPNDEPLELYRFQYRLTVNGVASFDGQWAALAALPPNDERSVTIPAVVLYERLGWSLDQVPTEASYQLSGYVLYNDPGSIAEILFDIGVRRPKARFTSSGVIELGSAGAGATAQTAQPYHTTRQFD